MTPDEKFFESSEFQSKLEYYEQCIEEGHSPFMDPDDLTDIADYYNYCWEPEKADNAIELALEMHPGATLPLTFKVREYMMLGQYDEAEKYWALIVNKDDPEACYAKAELMIAQGKIDEADNYLEENYKALDVESQQDFIIDAAAIWEDFHHCDRAMSWTMRLNPRNLDTEALELIARIHFGLKQYDESIKLYERIIDKKPFSLRTWFSLASAYYMNNNPEEAERSVGFALAIDPNDLDSLQLKGNILTKVEKYDKAIEAFKRYMVLVPDDMMTYISLATCYYAKEDMAMAKKMALKAFNTVKGKDPDVAVQACEHLVLLELDQNHVDEANKWIEKAEQLTDDVTEPLLLKAHVLLYQQRLQEALQMFHDAVELSDRKNEVIVKMLASLLDNGYRKLGISAVRYYCSMEGVADEELEKMTPEELIQYLKQNLDAKW